MKSRQHFVLLVAGMVCTAAIVALFLTGQISEFAEHEAQRSSSSVGFSVCGIAAIAMMLFSSVAAKSGFRRLIAWTTLVLAVAWSITSLAFLHIGLTNGSNSLLLHFVLNACGQVLIVLLLAQINLPASLLNDLKAIDLTTLALIMAAALYLICSSLGSPVLLVSLLLIAAAVCNLILELAFTGNPASAYALQALPHVKGPEPDEAGLSTWNILAFFGSRAAWGLSVGLFVGSLEFGSSLAPISNLPVLLSLILLGLFTLQTAIRTVDKVGLLVTVVAVPLFVVVIVLGCFYSSQGTALLRPLASVVILIWLISLGIQTPVYRRFLNVDPVVFAYSEKLGAYAICCFVAASLHASWVPTQIIGSALDQLSLFFPLFVLFLLVALLSLANHALRYLPMSALAGRKLETPQLHDAIAKASAQAKLTPKEVEVLYYVSTGYSRPYIEKALYISKATAKTHIHHIYQKLGVGTQDELIETIRRLERI